MSHHYIFENGKVKKASLLEWCIFFECCEREAVEIWSGQVLLGIMYGKDNRVSIISKHLKDVPPGAAIGAGLATCDVFFDLSPKNN